MLFRPVQVSPPPPSFELQVRAGLARLPASELPAPYMMERLRCYLTSMLLAEGLPASTRYLTMFLNRFAQLLARSSEGKPVLYQRRKSMALMFDAFSLQSEMRIDEPDQLVLGYTQSMMGFLLFHAEPRQIGMIGLGGGSLAKFCYRHLPGASIAVAEIDAEVIAMRGHFRIPDDDARLAVHCIDGARFVQQGAGRYDVLMVDGFDYRGQPPQLCSQRFYDDCHLALNDSGVMVVNLANDDLLETAAYIERMRRSFDGAVIVVDALDSLNTIVFCCKGGAASLDGLDTELLQQRLRQLDMLHPIILRSTAQGILAQRHAMARLPRT
jgi:spermidine synthase